MILPTAIQTYFDADSAGDVDTLLGAFAPAAIVRDEGRSHAGHEAIRAWWRETKAKYETAIAPLEMGRDGEAVLVRAMVRGRFPTSPTALVFVFRLNDDQISHLEIRP